jgi:hypothetical protein
MSYLNNTIGAPSFPVGVPTPPSAWSTSAVVEGQVPILPPNFKAQHEISVDQLLLHGLRIMEIIEKSEIDEIKSGDLTVDVGVLIVFLKNFFLSRSFSKKTPTTHCWPMTT